MKQLLTTFFLCSLLSVSVAGPPYGSEPDEFMDLAFDEALDILETEAPRAFRLAIDTMLGVAESGADLRFGSPDELFGDAAREIETAFYLIGLASSRIVAEPDPARILGAMVSANALTLDVLLDTVRFGSRSESLKEAMRSDPAVQRRLLDALGDTRTMFDLLLDQEQQQRLTGLEGTAWFEELASDETIGQAILDTALELLAPADVPDLLTSIVDGRRFAHLRDDVEELVLSGHIRHLVEMPAEWLRDRVAAGETMWLGSLAALGDEADLPLLLEHVERLPAEHQLTVLAAHFDPVFAPLVVQLHQHWVVGTCTDCPAYGDRHQAFARLVQLHAQVNTDASMDRIVELIEVAPDTWRTELVHHAVLLLGSARSEAGSKVALELLTDYPEVELYPSMLRDWMNPDSDALRRAVELRLPRLVGQLTDEGDGSGFDTWQSCNALSVLLVAHDEQWFDDWAALVEVMLAVHGPERLAWCNTSLVMALSGSTHLRGTLAAIDLLDQVEADGESYDWLIRSTLGNPSDNFEQRRLALLERLDGRPVWEELSQRSQDWLTGQVEPRAASLSCSAPDDWDPEDGDDDWVSAAGDG